MTIYECRMNWAVNVVSNLSTCNKNELDHVVNEMIHAANNTGLFDRKQDFEYIKRVAQILIENKHNGKFVVAITTYNNSFPYPYLIVGITAEAAKQELELQGHKVHIISSIIL